MAQETVSGCLYSAVRALTASSSATTERLDAEVLLAHVLGWTKTEIHARITDPVLEEAQEKFWRLIECRCKGVPVAYLVGWKEFYGRRFGVRPGVLVPRPETELLVEQGLKLLRYSPGPARVLDLGSGSGCIGITIALEAQIDQVVVTDVAEDPLAQIKENIAYHGVEQRVLVLESDLFSQLKDKRFDLILSNPPYVGTEIGPRPDLGVVAFEPALALFSGRDGTEHLKAIVERAPRHLIEGGSLVVECASFQAEKVEAWMAELGYAQTRLWHDLTGLPRGASGRWEGY